MSFLIFPLVHKPMALNEHFCFLIYLDSVVGLVRLGDMPQEQDRCLSLDMVARIAAYTVLQNIALVDYVARFRWYNYHQL